MQENFINKIPLKVYRYFCWKKAQDKVYKEKEKNYGAEFANLCYDAERSIYMKHPTEEVLLKLKKKDDFILDHIERTCSKVIEKALSYQFLDAERKTTSGGIIWVFWWTGENDAPDVVKACIKSIRRNANGHKVVMLDKNNISEFVKLPDFIDIKHEMGKIGHAHYSDVVRFALLSKYGGMWIDSTVFLSQQVPNDLFSKEFYTAKAVDCSSYYFSHSRWVGYFLAGSNTFPLFTFVRDMLFEYWKNTDIVIDYLLMDYIIDIAYRYIPNVKAAIDDVPDNNLERGQLMKKINDPYSKDLFDVLENGETFLSKLSWRYGNPVPTNSDGSLTNYGYLLSL